MGPERAAVRDRRASFYPESDGEPRPDFKQESNLITFACQKEQAGWEPVAGKDAGGTDGHFAIRFPFSLRKLSFRLRQELECAEEGRKGSRERSCLSGAAVSWGPRLWAYPGSWGVWAPRSHCAPIVPGCGREHLHPS